MRSKIKGTGYYVPDNVVSNFDLEKIMDTSDAWIQERTGIKERRYAQKGKETTSTMATKAAQRAMQQAGVSAEDIDFIILATLSPDYYFPGAAVLVQRMLGLQKKEIGALDIRTQCTGFIYGLSIGDQFIRSGMYKNILVIGAEMHSMGMDMSTKGRNISVIFGDGAGAVVLQATNEEGSGIITTNLHSNGDFAEELAMISPGCHAGYHEQNPAKYGAESATVFDSVFITPKIVEDGLYFPNMNGQLVFKNAVVKFTQTIEEALRDAGKRKEDIDMLIPHQANLRISQFIQKRMGLEDDRVWNNIQRYGNTTAASIPIALAEAVENKAISEGDLVCLSAFGSGFTWGSVLFYF